MLTHWCLKRKVPDSSSINVLSLQSAQRLKTGLVFANDIFYKKKRARTLIDPVFSKHLKITFGAYERKSSQSVLKEDSAST